MKILQTDIKGKKAIVTGAGKGIGQVVAEEFAASGASVLIADLNEENGNKVVKDLHDKGYDAYFIKTDLSSEADLENMVKMATEKFGGIDIIVNNARPWLSNKPFPECMESWQVAMDVSLKAPAMIVAYALPWLEKSDNPSVINISSTNAVLISQQPLTYHVAKAGVLQITKHLACELGPKKIRVNAICPGLVDIENRERKLTDNPEFKKITESVVPLQRASTGHDVAELSAFLSSEGASYITGQSFMLDGGMTLGDQFARSFDTLNYIFPNR